MTIVNERVEHIMFGFGVITQVESNKVWVQFQDDIERKAFLYPEAFEKFLKAVNVTVQNSLVEELRKKQDQIEEERKVKERLDAELEERKPKLAPVKRKPGPKSTKKIS
jgi:hypothetical protein